MIYHPYLLPQFIATTAEQVLLVDMKDSGSLPICVISDIFLLRIYTWYLPQYYIMHASDHHILNSDSQESVQLPGLTLPFSLTRVDIPEAFLHFSDPENRMTQFFDKLGESETNSWGVIVNSFAELENEQVGNLESFYKQEGAKAWCVGPLFLYHDMDGEDEADEIIKSLDEHGDGSVVNVSFGTQSYEKFTIFDEWEQTLPHHY
ncbi:hypothetical protein MKW92_048124 [Papaver armeniacum]|nr:hypothetical protein MKW92_048124 [Papaver armeniacum]